MHLWCLDEHDMGVERVVRVACEALGDAAKSVLDEGQREGIHEMVRSAGSRGTARLREEEEVVSTSQWIG